MIFIVMLIAQGGEWKSPADCGVEERGGGESSREPRRRSHHLQSDKAYGKEKAFFGDISKKIGIRSVQSHVLLISMENESSLIKFKILPTMKKGSN